MWKIVVRPGQILVTERKALWDTASFQPYSTLDKTHPIPHTAGVALTRSRRVRPSAWFTKAVHPYPSYSLDTQFFLG